MNNTRSKLWTIQFSTIVLLTFIFFLCLQMLTAGFPIYVTGLSHNPAEGGITTTAFMLAAIATRPFLGALIHKVDMKKTLISTLLFVLATIIMSYGRESLIFLIILRLFQGIGFGIVTTILATFATNLIPKDRIGEGIGYFGMATSLGTTAAPMIALSFIHKFPFTLLILFVLALSLIAFVFSFFIKNTQVKTRGNNPGSNQKLIHYVFDLKAFLPCILVMLFYITFSGVVNFLDGLGESIHIGGKISIFFLINAVITIVIRPFSGKVFDKFGHRYLIYPASFSAIIGLIILGFSHSFVSIIIAAIFYGAAYGIMQPTFQAWAVSRVSPDKKATANAMSFSFMDLGMAIGAATLGNVVNGVGYNNMYSGSSILIMLLIVIYAASSLKHNKIQKTADNTINI